MKTEIESITLMMNQTFSSVTIDKAIDTAMRKLQDSKK